MKWDILFRYHSAKSCTTTPSSASSSRPSWRGKHHDNTVQLPAARFARALRRFRWLQSRLVKQTLKHGIAACSELEEPGGGLFFQRGQHSWVKKKKKRQETAASKNERTALRWNQQSGREEKPTHALPPPLTGGVQPGDGDDGTGALHDTKKNKHHPKHLDQERGCLLLVERSAPASHHVPLLSLPVISSGWDKQVLWLLGSLLQETTWS